MAKNWRKKLKEKVESSPDYTGYRATTNDAATKSTASKSNSTDWRQKIKDAVNDGSAAKKYQDRYSNGTADALIANNPAYVYTKAYGDGKTGAAANKVIKGAATPRSRFEPADTGRPLGRASAQRAFTSTPTGNFKGEAVLKSALSSSSAAYKKLGADVTSSTGNLSMGESARTAIDEAKTAKKEGRQVKLGQAQRKAEQDKVKSFNDGWAGDFKKKLLESAEESSKRAYEYEQEAKEGLGKFGQGVVDFGIAGAQFAGDALLNAVAPGTGLAAMAGRAYGSASLDAQQRGLSEGEQQISGLKSAAIEMLTEKLFGSVSKVAYGKGIIRNESLVNSLVNRLAKTDRGRTALKVLVGANEEGLEEVLSDILNPIADRILKLDDGKGDWSDLVDDFDTQQMLEDYIIGGALGLAGAGTNVASGQYRAENAQQRAYEEYQRQLVNAGLATEKGGDAQLTAEKYKNILDQSTQRGKRNLSDKETENLERLIRGTYAQEDTSDVSTRLAQLGTDASEQTVNAIVKAVNGETLSRAEQKAFDANPYSQRVVNEMLDTEGVTSNEWYADRASAQSFTPEVSSGINIEQAQNVLAASTANNPQFVNSMARQYEVAPEVVERTYNLNPTAPQAFETAFNAVYQMGQQGTDKAALSKVPVLNTAQANIAYQMGADSVNAANVSTEAPTQAATVQAAAPVTINNTQEVNENGVRIHNVAERINGQNTEGQIRGVETGAGENVAGGSQKEQGGAGAAQIKAGEKVSYKGKQQKGVYYAAEDTEDMKKGRKLAESYGYKVRYFVGGNIRYAGGEFRGVVDTANKTVMVRADHPDYTAEQIMRHEMGHAAFENGDLSLNEAREMLLDAFTEDELNELIEIYSSEYGGILSTDEAFEEICCDALGRMNIFEGTDLNSESYGKAQDTVRKYAAERTGSKGRAPPKKGGVKYSFEASLTNATKAIQSMGRKSINDFTSADIEKTRPFAEKYWREMGTKSPFFRAWFGDWRANDKTPVQIASKKGSVRGIQKNDDTGWNINVSAKVFNETKSHNSVSSRAARKYLPYIDDIVKKAVLLDSFTIGKAKSSNSLLMHSLYTVADIGNGPEVLKLYVEEMNDPNQRDTRMRTYHLQNIENQQTGAKGSGNILSLVTQPAGKISVSDLFSYVKQKDGNFNPKPASKVTNADGTPKIVYHQTENEFTVFETRREGAGARDNGTPFGIFLKSSNKDIGLRGKKQMALYAKIENPLRAKNRSEFLKAMQSMSSEYAEIINQHEALDREYKEKTQSAIKEFKNYIIEWRADNPGVDSRALYDDAKFNELFEAEDTLASEWTSKADKLSTKAKEAMTKALESNGYDGVILEKDDGSFGRSTDAYIALHPEQVKSATDNIGTFDSSNPDIRYSREPERLNELRRQNERKLAQATAEDAANENERGLIRDYQKQYSKVEDIREKLSAAQQTLTEAEDSGADYDTTTKAKNRFTLLSKQYAREHRKLNGYGSAKALQNVLERVSARTSKDAEHIDNRNFSNVGDRSLKPFQMEHPELHKYYEDMAQTVLYDIGMATQFRTTNGYPKNKFTDGFKRALGGSSFNDGLQALLDISNDQGSENYALAKRMELFLDDLLTNGYKGASGNAEYIRAKENISGGNTVWENFLEENSLAIADGLITEKELYKEFTQMRSDLPEGMGAASANFTGEETVGERWVTEAQGKGNSALHPISKEQEANLAEQQHRAPQEIPKKDLNGKLTSKHVSTIANSGMTPAEFSEAMLDDAALGKFSHIAYSDEEALEKANGKIAEKGWTDALASYKAEINSGRVSKDNTVMGIALYNNAVNSGDYATAMDIASLMVKNSTNTAQSLQAMRILNKLSPECRLYLAAKSIENIEEDLNERYKDNKADIHVDKILYDEYAKALRQGDEDGIKTAWANIEQSVAQQIDATWYEKLNNFRYLAMLGNPRTHVRNFLGNALFTPVREVKNIIAYGIENMVDAKIDGGIERSKAILNSSNATDKALIDYGKMDYAAMQDVILSGGKYNDNFSGIDNNRTIYDKVKPLETLRKANSKALDKEDAFFCKNAYAYALARWYKSNGISAEQLLSGQVADETVAKAQAIAVKEAQKATYRDINVFSQWVSNLGKTRYKAVNVLVEGILPFKKTPANILARGMEYSPVGLMKSLWDIRRVKSYVNGDVENGMSPAQFIDEVSAGLTGTALVGLGVLLAWQGMLLGGSGDDDKQSKFDELSGNQKYALDCGSFNVTLDWLAPECLPVFVGVELYNSLSGKNDSANVFDGALKSLASVTTPVLEMSMLQSVSDLINNIGYVDDASGMYKIFSKSVTSYLTQYFPTILGQAERTFEETQREMTYVDRNSAASTELQYMWGKIANKIPFYDFSQIPYIDAWGRTEETGNFFVRALNNFINPAYVKKARPTEIDDELERLYDLGETGVYPTRPKVNVQIKGEYLTADEYVVYSTRKGQLSLDLATQFINSAEYSRASDVKKAYLIKKAYEYANDIAKYEVNNDVGFGAKWEEEAYKSSNPGKVVLDHWLESYDKNHGDKEN